ncbi:ectoine synthase [Marinobacteraceae bacterium S3BR75-40.1]
MLVRSIQEREGTEDEVDDNGFISRRLILAEDGMHYSVHDTEIPPNTSLDMWYKHHFETVLITDGEGEIEDLATRKRHTLKPGVLYALNEHDQHILHASKKGLRMICVFYPALVGPETHQADGSYPIYNLEEEIVEN